jgi:uncharacterized protein YdbL (DUF1318 family)
MARRTTLLLVALICLVSFAAGALYADQAKEQAYAGEVVDATDLVAYMTDSGRSMLDLWAQQKRITEAERDTAKQTLTTGKSRAAIRDVATAALVDEFDEATLARVAAFYKTAEGRAWAMRYEDTMQKATNTFGLAMLKGIVDARK